jgi:pilus assembly protein CpaF
MLQAMNTGHEGSLTTIHANDTRDALGRLEIMVGMAGFELPLWVIRRQISSTINIVVQVSRLQGGARKMVKVSEVTGVEGENYVMQDIFLFKQTGLDDDGRAQGWFHATGLRPMCLERLASVGAPLPLELFERRIIQPAAKKVSGPFSPQQ